MTIEALILTEHNRLVELERTIEAGLKTFVDVGNALLEIRDGKLYRGTDGTFEEYCGNRWSLTSVQAKRLIDGAIIATNIEPTGSKIVSESHLRPLKNLRPDEQREVYQRAVETAPNGMVSAAHVEKVVKAYKQEIEPIEPEEPFLPDDENRVLYEEPAPEAEQVEPSGFDPSIHQAYCKYCYQTHSDWEASADHSEAAWYCERCEHATADRFIDFEPVPEQREEETENPTSEEIDPASLLEMQYQTVRIQVEHWVDAELAQTREKYRKELWNTMVKIDRERGGY